jgi:cytochrome c peroxidase
VARRLLAGGKSSDASATDGPIDSNPLFRFFTLARSMTATRKPLLAVLVGLVLTGCGKWADDLFCSSEGCGWTDGEWVRVAALANPGPPPVDTSNRFGSNRYAIVAGQAFYFDSAFSGTATQSDAIRRTSPPARAAKGQPLGISCASCHDLARAGVDTTSVPGHVSVGAGWTDVNALAVVNSAYRPVVFWNGRADSLWALNVVVAESATTMNGNRLRTAHRFVEAYLRPGLWPAEPDLLGELGYLMQRQFGCPEFAAALDAVAAMPPDGKPGTQPGCQSGDPSEPFGDAFDCLSPLDQQLATSLLVVWAKAIAAYEYQLTSVDSPFDRFVHEGPSSDAISPAAKRGARLFVGKGACIDCHGSPQLTDDLFHNIGVPQAGLAVPTTADCPHDNAACDCSTDHESRPCAPWGAYDGLSRLQTSRWLRSSAWSDDRFDRSRDAYVMRERSEDLKGAWRTPSLRNVALTAPYMHDGRYATLQDVIWHYNTGGLDAGPEQVGVPAPQMKPLLLTDGEQADLVAFLESLTGRPVSPELAVAPELGRAQPVSCGNSGATGGSGGGGSGPPGCMGTPSATPLVADFSDVQGTPPATFGAAPGITGAMFTYAAPGLAPPGLSVQTGANGTPALQVAVHPGAATDPANTWLGFGLVFDSCVDARQYDAVKLTIGGDLGTCAIRFAVTSSQTVFTGNDPRGTCAQEPCYPPSIPLRTTGQVIVPFRDLATLGHPDVFPGSPNVVDPGALIGIQWQMDALPGAPCDSNFTIDDIAFVRTGPTGAAGAGGSIGGSAGRAGTGGAGGSPPAACISTPPPSESITDFSATMPVNPIRFAGASGLTGRVFSSVFPPVAPIPTAIVSIAIGDNATPALVVSTVPNTAVPPGVSYVFGLAFDSCVDARAFGGVRFTIGGISTSCPPPLFGVMSKQFVGAAEDPRGTCLTNCTPPLTSIYASGATVVPFSAEIDPTSIVGIQWRVPVSCGARLTIDDIGFVTP